MNQIVAYECKWCGKISRTKSGIANHERYCHGNPEFNCCQNCKHAEIRNLVVGGWPSTEPYCTAVNAWIFNEDKRDNAYFCECETYDNSGGMRDEVPVPYTCHSFESKGEHGFEYPAFENLRTEKEK